MFCVFAEVCGLFAMSEIAVGSVFRVFGGALAGGALLRIYGIQRGRMVPLFLYVPRGEGRAERIGLSKMYLDRYCVEVKPVDLEAALLARILPYLPGKRMVMERLGCRGWGQLRLSTLRLKGRCLEDILFKNPDEPRLPLSPEEKTRFRRWRIESSDRTACIVMGRADSLLRAHYLEMDASLQAGRLRQLVRKSISDDLRSRLVLTGDVWPCVGGCERGMAHVPVMVRVGRRPSLYALLEMFGLSFDDPLSKYLLDRASLGLEECLCAHRTLCQGLSGHVMHTLFATLAEESPIATVDVWRVVTSFAGGNTFWSHLRRFGRSAVLVQSCESDRRHQWAHRSQGFNAIRFLVGDVSREAAIGGVPEHDLRFAGFPCVKYSSLNRHATRAELMESLRVFDFLVDSLRVFAPPVVILENVAGLMCSRLDWVREHVEEALRGLAGGRYMIFRSVLCSSEFESTFRRRRVYYVMYLF